jgi:hypothetical protein
MHFCPVCFQWVSARSAWPWTVVDIADRGAWNDSRINRRKSRITRNFDPAAERNTRQLIRFLAAISARLFEDDPRSAGPINAASRPGFNDLGWHDDTGDAIPQNGGGFTTSTCGFLPKAADPIVP